jgi:hypothetical protein
MAVAGFRKEDLDLRRFRIAPLYKLTIIVMPTYATADRRHHRADGRRRRHPKTVIILIMKKKWGFQLYIS